MKELTEVNYPTLQEIVTAFTKINFDDNFIDLSDVQWELVDKVMRDSNLSLSIPEICEAKYIMMRYAAWRRHR